MLPSIVLSRCISNAANNATPAPTELAGIYKAGIFGGSVTWEILPDGTGVACEQRTSMAEGTKIRDMVINGDKAYDVFEYTLNNTSKNGFLAEGIVNLQFKKINKMPAACRYNS